MEQGRWILGGVQLGLPYGAVNASGQPSAATAAAILGAAALAGATHVDTARAYGESEAVIGAARQAGWCGLGLVTKVRPLADGEGGDEAAASITASLAALHADRVDALLLHRQADWARPGVRDALLAARDDGRAGRIGVSLSTPAELVAALADPATGYVQFPFNALDRRWLAPAIQDALGARRDVVVTVRSVYLQGLLVAGEARHWPANAGRDVPATLATLDALVDELGRESRADLALAYALGQPWVTSVVLGAETVDQVVENGRLAGRPALSDAERARVRERLAPGADDLVDPSRWRRNP